MLCLVVLVGVVVDAVDADIARAVVPMKRRTKSDERQMSASRFVARALAVRRRDELALARRRVHRVDVFARARRARDDADFPRRMRPETALDDPPRRESRRHARAADAHASALARGIEEDRARERAVRGTCARCGMDHVMARTAEAEAEARAVATAIRASGRIDYDAEEGDERFSADRLDAPDGGKMIGALVGVDGRTGERVTLKAFSGQLYGEWRVEGWAPPVGTLTHDTETYEMEHAKIKALSEAIGRMEVEEKMVRAEVREKTSASEQSLRDVGEEAKRAREARRRAREEGAGDEELRVLEEESRASKRMMAEMKRARDAAVAPKLELLAQLRARVQEMKTERKALSHALQDEIWDSYRLPSLAGDVRPLREVFHPPVPALPCGCADCCAPKLLNWAHARGVKPISIAEMWIGAPRPRDFRVPGVFYGACRDKCVPIMAHMLCPAEQS